jgi:hypothetical protein
MRRPTCEGTCAIGRLALALLASLVLAPPAAALAGPEEALLRYPALGRSSHRRALDIGWLLRRLEHAHQTSDLASAAALIDFRS